MTDKMAMAGRIPMRSSPSIIGRDRDLTTLAELLSHPEVRLLTLTGPGGVGKTRLALQAAIAYRATEGIEAFFVPLAPISDPDLVLSSIARELGVRKSGRRPLVDHLLHFLRDQPLLLLLDNFEQVVEAAGQLTRLIEECPELLLLVTSRERLRLSHEHEFSVPPLGVSNRLRRSEPTQALLKLPAVHLFVERVRSFRPNWNPLFAIASAVVTDTVGILCHASVVAREYRIPAVVGTREATTVFRNGELVEVDGQTGRVHAVAG